MAPNQPQPASDAELDQILFTYSTNTSKARQEIKAALLQWHDQALLAAYQQGRIAEAKACEAFKVHDGKAAETAYGGCHLCYGKGYATVNSRWHGGFVNGGYPNVMKFCTCDRGKQLKRQVKAAELRARIDELRKLNAEPDIGFAAINHIDHQIDATKAYLEVRDNNG